jgi:oxygen-dependent protoporphyrinogen oxidase
MGRVLLGGNYASGVALGKCVEHGYELATDIAGQVAAAKVAAA